MAKPLVTQACHCRDCQRATGSAFVIHIVVCEEDFRITGETHMGLGPTGSGTGCELHSCASCGVLIWVRYKYHKVPVIAVSSRNARRSGSGEAAGAHILRAVSYRGVLLPTEVPSFEEGIDRSQVWSKESIERYESLPSFG